MIRSGKWKNLSEKELDLLKTIILSRRTWDSDRIVAFTDTILDSYGICLPEVPPNEEILRMPINGLANQYTFTVRLQNILKAEGFQTVGDIVKQREIELLRLPNMGRRSLNDLKTCLANVGLELKP